MIPSPLRFVLAAITLAALWLPATASAQTFCPIGDPDCSPGCNYDSECLDGEVCEFGECIPGCRDDIDCTASEVCDLATNTCETATPEQLVAAACPCDGGWPNHGQYVRCVVHAVDDLGLDPAEADGLVAAAATSTCGK